MSAVHGDMHEDRFASDTERLAKSHCGINQDTEPDSWRSYHQASWGKSVQRGFNGFASSFHSSTLKRLLLFAVIAIAALAWLARVHTVYLSTGSVRASAFALKTSGGDASPVQSGAAVPWVKPEGIKIVAFMYYGRRTTVQILECYLRKNLASNGGFLDEVLFIVNTDDEGDLVYLSEIVGRFDEYKKVVRDGSAERTTAYEEMLRLSIVPDALMIKIDDDLVWMDENAIPELALTLIDHPEAFSVLANLVNSAALGWLHYHRGAIHAFLPEREAPINPQSISYGPSAWRISALPTWQPPIDNGTTEPTPAVEDSEAVYASTISNAGTPYPNHRWLPMNRRNSDIYETPMADTQYDPFSNDWKEWSIAAQQHYSLLENIERDQLDRYTMGGDGTWNLRRMRGNINLVAFWANDVLANLPFDGSGDDEHQLTITLPQRNHKGKAT